jgi:hypothetical protein
LEWAHFAKPFFTVSYWTLRRNLIIRVNVTFEEQDRDNWKIRILRRYNLRNADIVRFIKSRRMNWIGHVMRMEGWRIPRRILERKPIGRRIRGRPRKRWIEDVEDFQAMGRRG